MRTFKDCLNEIEYWNEKRKTAIVLSGVGQNPVYYTTGTIFDLRSPKFLLPIYAIGVHITPQPRHQVIVFTDRDGLLESSEGITARNIYFLELN